MTRINTNVESLRGLRNYQRANTQLNTSLSRLSTGLKINNGRDNPSGLIASETLRLQVTTIEQSISNSNRANNVLGTADSALGEIGGLLNQVRGLVQEGLNVGALSQDEITANQQQIDAALSAINRISANTSFGGDKLIDGSKSFTTNVSAIDSGRLQDFRINEAILGPNSSLAVSSRVTAAAEKAQLRYTSGDLTAATTLEVGGSTGQQTVFLGAASTLSQIESAINGVSDSTGVDARIISGYKNTKNAVANNLTTALTGANNDIVFSDARATTSAGTNASLGGGTVSIQYVDPGANNGEFSIATAVDGDGNATVTVNLATNGSGAITTTANQVLTALGQNEEASQYITGALAAGNDGTTAVTALASTALAGGTDQAALAFTDKRTAGSLGTVSVVFADPGANNAALSVGVARTGNDSVITVNLATGGAGAITSSYDDIRDAIIADLDASSLVDVSLEGDEDAVAAAQASTTLSEATGTLVLESSGYGSSESVSVSVLNGSFATFDAAGSTPTGRDTGTDIAAIINGQAVEGTGLTVNYVSTFLNASVSFSESANEADTTATINITGGGALFQIGQEATSTGQIGIGLEAVNTARLGGISGKLFELGTGGGKSLQNVKESLEGTGSFVDPSSLVSIVEEALNRVTSLRGRIGAIQRNVVDTNISTLGVALENISEARSQIVDTDFAAETASLQKSQILTQAGISVLSIANQTGQGVLNLLR